MGEGFAVIDAWRLDVGPTFSCRMYVEFCSIEASEIVDYGGIEFQGVVGFQVEALVTFYGVTGAVAFGETVAGEAFDLMPNLGDELGFMSFLRGGIEEFILHFLKLFSAAEFSAHATT